MTKHSIKDQLWQQKYQNNNDNTIAQNYIHTTYLGFLKVRLHDKTGCQNGCETGLTTGCIV